MSLLLEELYTCGARPADPGEFTQRAFLNGRIDLTQAEGIRESIEAQTVAQLRLAGALRTGRLRDSIAGLRQQLQRVLGEIEVSVDFCEEVGEFDRVEAVARIGHVQDSIRELLASAPRGRMVREGVTVAIIGRPNAGKSSLLNALLGQDRAIVAPTPGTTRDTVSEWTEIEGIPVHLIDTAGLRNSQDDIEMQGVARAREAAADAHHVLYVYDCYAGWDDDDTALIQMLERPYSVIANKADIGTPAEGYAVSALLGSGLENVTSALISSLTNSQPTVPYINRRHEPLLQAALDHLELSKTVLASNVPVDLAVVGLQSALLSLGEITGDVATPNILEQVFQDFCIGK